jgi:hypothetical protein
MKSKQIGNEEIIKITHECKQPREQAFFTFIRQSGLTPNQAKQLRIQDLENILDPNPSIPSAIKQPLLKDRPAFIGYEAVKYLKAYLSTRRNLTPQTLLFASSGITANQINTHNLSTTFTQIARKLLKDGKIVHKIKLYDFVSFFRTKAKLYLKEPSNSTTSHDVEFWRKQYKEKALPNLEIEPLTPLEMHQLRSTIDQILTKVQEPEFVEPTPEEWEEMRKQEQRDEMKREKWAKKHPEEAKRQAEEDEKTDEEAYQYFQQEAKYRQEHPEIIEQEKEQYERSLENRITELEEALDQIKKTIKNPKK